VLEQLAALAKIAEIDAVALRSDIELKEIPERMSELAADVQRLGEMLEAERTEVKDAATLLSAQEEEMQNQNQALAKSKAKSARARNMREADAVERELEVIRRTMKEREEEREKLRVAIEKRSGSVQKHEKELAELRRFEEEEKAKADARLAELRAHREQVMQGRRELAALLPPEVLRRYDMVREKRAGIGAAPVNAGICAGCHTSLRPMQVIAAIRGETFEQCPRCQRFLFSPEALKGTVEAAAASAADDGGDDSDG
jgi:predicted  nucleic acid-binding Zn-ribbon protein